ncbi:MAG: hypothetical protein ABL894_02835 [Hyphomicrobium sp.]
MRKTKLRFAAAAALIGLLGTFATVAQAEIRRNGDGGNRQSAITNNLSNRPVNRGKHYNGRSSNRSGYSSYSSRKYYRSYGNNYRNRGGNGFGIYLDLDSNSSGCSYSYRKWQVTGSRYWRARYYDCVG